MANDPTAEGRSDQNLVERLRNVPAMSDLPREELEWLVQNGSLDVYEAGAVVAAEGKPVGNLFIIVSGRVAVWVDRGNGLRRVMEWRAGEVTGMVPYSRMKAPPGDNRAEETSELLTIPVNRFPDMVNHCPEFTSGTVHSMVDRARTFRASDLQDEKMISLGKLASGLAHELNNPSSAAVRSAKVLQDTLADADAATRALGERGIPPAALDLLERVLGVDAGSAVGAESERVATTALDLADREDELSDWLERQSCDLTLAGPLADMCLTVPEMDALAGRMAAGELEPSLKWVTARYMARTLSDEIWKAATRIHDLISVVKRFTYMDNLAAPDVVDVEDGLRDTIEILAPRAASSDVGVRLEVDENLPRVTAIGGEMNQVWMSLIDNALDAVSEGGAVDVTARLEVGRVVVSVTDDGPGIAPEILPQIFDPLFTTKPPGAGIGMGLEIARRLVRRSLGEISVESRPGRTEFRVSLIAEES